MSLLKKVAVRALPAIIGLACLIFLWSNLSKSTYFENLSQYGVPMCSIDRHRFAGETCEECGRSITSFGVFFSIKEAETNPGSDSYELHFTDFYKDYESFKLDYDYCSAYSCGVLLVIAWVAGCYISLFVFLRRNKKK